jgi:hypothetical protein
MLAAGLVASSGCGTETGGGDPGAQTATTDKDVTGVGCPALLTTVPIGASVYPATAIIGLDASNDVSASLAREVLIARSLEANHSDAATGANDLLVQADKFFDSAAENRQAPWGITPDSELGQTASNLLVGLSAWNAGFGCTADTYGLGAGYFPATATSDLTSSTSSPQRWGVRVGGWHGGWGHGGWGHGSWRWSHGGWRWVYGGGGWGHGHWEHGGGRVWY